MSHCSINFEDDPSGEIATMLRFTDGQDPHSHAHTMAVQVMKWLEERAATKREETVETVNHGVISTPAKGVIYRP